MPIPEVLVFKPLTNLIMQLLYTVALTKIKYLLPFMCQTEETIICFDKCSL